MKDTSDLVKGMCKYLPIEMEKILGGLSGYRSIEEYHSHDCVIISKAEDGSYSIVCNLVDGQDNCYTGFMSTKDPDIMKLFINDGFYKNYEFNIDELEKYESNS